MDNLVIQKNYFREFHNVFASRKLLTKLLTYLLIKFVNKTKFFLRNTKNTRDMKLDSHHYFSERDEIGKGYIV